MIDTTANHEAHERRALVALFDNRAIAHDALASLRAEAFNRVWLGSMLRDGSLATDEKTTLGERIGKFFSGWDYDRPLFDALVRNGVEEQVADALDRSIPPNSIVMTVDGRNHPELAAEIIERCGGQVLAGETFEQTIDARDGTPASGARALGYGDSDRYARGESIDADRLIQLRSERIEVEKFRVPDREVELRTVVVDVQQRIDVPVIREEIFLERRAPSDALRSVEPIGANQTFRITLAREEFVVTKRPVIVEEVRVGKRFVSEVRQIDETLKQERLEAVDPSAADSVAAAEENRWTHS